MTDCLLFIYLCVNFVKAFSDVCFNFFMCLCVQVHARNEGSFMMLEF